MSLGLLKFPLGLKDKGGRGQILMASSGNTIKKRLWKAAEDYEI